MKRAASTAAVLSLPLTTLAAPHIFKRDKISSCGPTWMTNQDIHGVQGFQSAKVKFCQKAAGSKLQGGDSLLSMATEVWINDGRNPDTYGLPGYVYFEVHNKASVDHTVDEADCIKFFDFLSKEGECYGGDGNGKNKDTKGGTWQIGNNEITYHAVAQRVPPAKEEGWNELYTGGVLDPRAINKDGQSLDPWPLDFTASVNPIGCHSHNDYEQDVPLFEALSAGCVSVEADVHEKDGKALIGHDGPGPDSRTLDAMYVGPLVAMLDAHQVIFPSKPDQSLTLLVDFKTNGDGLWQIVKDAIKPLREKGYLSTSRSGTFVEGKVTVVGSGKTPLDKVNSDEDKDIFFDAPVKDLTDDYNQGNSNYASGAYSDAVGGDKSKIQPQVDAAKGKGLHVRYWDLPSEGDYQSLIDAGVDRINMDDMSLAVGLDWSKGRQ